MDINKSMITPVFEKAYSHTGGLLQMNDDSSLSEKNQEIYKFFISL